MVVVARLGLVRVVGSLGRWVGNSYSPPSGAGLALNGALALGVQESIAADAAAGLGVRGRME